MKNDNYKNYFSQHYKLALNEQDIENYERWFISQWNLILREVSFKRNQNVLEIGSGIGGLYSLLKKSIDIQYEGIELDKEAVDFTNKHFGTSVFKHTSLEDYKPNKKFDYIFAFEVLEHLENPYESIQKIYKLLNDDGLFVGTSPYPFAKNVYADNTHLSVLHPENWKRLFLYSGFSSVVVAPMSFAPFLWRVHPNLNLRLPFYVPFPGCIATTLIIAKKE